MLFDEKERAQAAEMAFPQPVRPKSDRLLDERVTLRARRLGQICPARGSTESNAAR